MGQNSEGSDQCRLGEGARGGLYQKEDEHDSCGIGFVADIKGRKSHAILSRGLEVLERMEHRGAESADNKTGDGSGVLMQIPHGYYKTLIPGLPGEGTYGTGLAFFPGPGGDKKTAGIHRIITRTVEELAGALGLGVHAWRDVPVNSGVIGSIARAAEPVIKQLVLVPLAPGGEGQTTDDAGGISDLEFRLYIFRKKLEKLLRADETLKKAGAECYFPSLSSRTIVYKGMLMPSQLRDYYPELQNPGIETAVALVHSRFSTNTFPNWPLAQPFRMVSHNGEINTIKGNRFWIRARQALFEHPRITRLFPDGKFTLEDILPVIEPDRSDSASFDNALELLVMSGRSLPHALMMLIPES
ncbi:MAG: glutamate synthase subunit alpha, partial [Treponema sp.]|nr:glutamate synthase subunit alpha [Treponema sp.]